MKFKLNSSSIHHHFMDQKESKLELRNKKLLETAGSSLQLLLSQKLHQEFMKSSTVLKSTTQMVLSKCSSMSEVKKLPFTLMIELVLQNFQKGALGGSTTHHPKMERGGLSSLKKPLPSLMLTTLILLVEDQEKL